MTTNTIEATPPAKSKVEILTDVFALATQFSTCVEAFNLIHPSKDNDHPQKVALVKLGLQQGRLLIFGDAVGISSPPATIARYMIPSRPGLTNPDPNVPVNFGVRDARLDDEVSNEKVKKALNEIAGRPAHMSREELMDKFGLRSPKHATKILYPPLVHNRLEAFREKHGLLQDLVLQSGIRTNFKRTSNITISHWTVKDSARFEQFVKTIRDEVDALIDLFGVKEQVDRGTRSDIRCMAWHPELTGPIVQKDWEKLRLLREACEVDYPQYIEVIDIALQYLHEEIKESSLATHRAANQAKHEASIAGATGARRKSDHELAPGAPTIPAAVEEKTAIQIACEKSLNPNVGKEKRPSWLSAFKFKSWSKSHRGGKTQRSNSLPDASADPQRALSADKSFSYDSTGEDANALTTVRSKSLSAMSDDSGPLDLDSRMRNLSVDEGRDLPAIQENGVAVGNQAARYSWDKNALVQTQTVSSEGSDENMLAGATTVNSLIDRHDMYRGMGRIETKDIRGKAHEI
ncbi:hypothetical protein P153DRAFT_381480 [Dothidotthia symphoricarpi CBS 119687]|uniref:Prion-inhibition and propagation HeLo domain-containing protein n=1 Tax=Dothidotthia symphoricarpi CBS 119687 TaxID=1392245 RepID=A0A6A6AR62_9PLEO|nr:uncharacterized protein P153DRAFT_381480 [Dothidotthia symphoricarpi CBS 119687]KAF2134300.1 hypothetical protein P153DRAFT_381480 [Dothidotthia symphoricarpi CBS 119687]